MKTRLSSLADREAIKNARTDVDRNVNRRHAAAMNGITVSAAPAEQIERAIASTLKAWLRYGDAYADLFDSPIGHDYVLGPAWLKIGSGLLDLLNGEAGRLDCGTVDRIIRDAVREAGGDPDEL